MLSHVLGKEDTWTLKFSQSVSSVNSRELKEMMKTYSLVQQQNSECHSQLSLPEQTSLCDRGTHFVGSSHLLSAVLGESSTNSTGLFGEVVTAFFAVANYGLELSTRTKKRAETHWKYLSHFFVDQPPRFTLHMCCPWVGVCWGVLEVWRSRGFHHRSYTCSCRGIVFIPPATTKSYNSWFTGKISSMSCPEVWPQWHLEVQLFITVKLMHALGILRCF